MSFLTSWISIGRPLQNWFESSAGSLRDSESLSHLPVISEELSAYCIAAGLRVSRVSTEECELSHHLCSRRRAILLEENLSATSSMSYFDSILSSPTNPSVMVAYADFEGANGIIGVGPVDLTQATLSPDTNATIPSGYIIIYSTM